MEDIEDIISNPSCDGNSPIKEIEMDIEDGELSSESNNEDAPTGLSLQGKAMKNLHVEIELPDTPSLDTEDIAKNGNELSIGEKEDDNGIQELKVHNLNVPNNSEDDREVNIYLGEGLTFANRVYENKKGSFVAGIDVSSDEARVRRQERAKRFGLKISEEEDSFNASVSKVYESLGMCGPAAEGVEEPDESIYRLDTIHFRGTDNMSTDDIFWYYRDFPADKLEWIDDSSCNVVWLERSAACRAMLALSSAIVVDDDKGAASNTRPIPDDGDVAMGEEKEFNTKNIEDDSESFVKITEDTISIDEGIVATDTIDIIIDEQEAAAADSPSHSGKTKETEDDVQVHEADSKLKDLPVGKWRMGVAHPRAEMLLMRFATYSDCKKFGAEKDSKYYVKYGNPNYGGVSGFISESRRRRTRLRKLKEDLDTIALHQTKAPRQKGSMFDGPSIVMPKRPRRDSPPAEPAETCQSGSDNDTKFGDNHSNEDSESDEDVKWKGLTKGMRADKEEVRQRKRPFKERVHVPIWQRISFPQNDDDRDNYVEERNFNVDARQILTARRRHWKAPSNLSITVLGSEDYEEPDIERDLYTRYNFSHRDRDDDDAQSSRAEKDSGSDVEDGELKESPKEVGKFTHMWSDVLQEQKRQDAAPVFEDDYGVAPPVGRELVSYGDMVDLVNYNDFEADASPVLVKDLRQMLGNSEKGKATLTRGKSVESDSSQLSNSSSDSNENNKRGKHRQSWRRLRTPTPPPVDKSDLRHKLKRKKHVT